MPIIDYTYFSEPLLIPNWIEDTGTQEMIMGLVNQYEPEFLKQLLGLKLRKQFTEWMDAQTEEGVWHGVLNGHTDDNFEWIGLHCIREEGKQGERRISPIANYVYYWYKRLNATQTVASGEANIKMQNATAAEGSRKMATAWNDMVDMNWQCRKYMDKFFATDTAWITHRGIAYGYTYVLNSSTYRGWGMASEPDLFTKINTLNL